MKELSEWKDIIINKANKVGATFIVAVKEYIKAGQQHQQLQKTSRRSNNNKHEIINLCKRKIQKTKIDKSKSRWGPEKKWLHNTEIASTTKNT